ncbi:protection of telomeres protein 1a isoform X1 [Papaver somniferum]|uniref:protection of telomeres protein 1a isoform X1 n=1 Tax=Papaver somniferum TaxID=3469 RepID=UPI000E7052F9|nr:protection of telomeres protein 1a isoform X1 [Papaver somniferum]
MTSFEDDKCFLPIRDAILAINQKVNLIGMISEFGTPQKSKGTDYFCTLKIMDESYHIYDSAKTRKFYGLVVNMFATSIEDLPQINSVGDIICFSQVLMKTHDGITLASYSKKGSSFALFTGKSRSLISYQSSSNFRLSNFKKSLSRLRTWMLDFQLDSGLDESLDSLPLREIKEKETDLGSNKPLLLRGMKNNATFDSGLRESLLLGKMKNKTTFDSGLKEPLLLREISENQTSDLVCKILHVSELSKGVKMLYVWDGTDVPPLICQSVLSTEVENPFPLQFEELPLPREVLCTFPSVGTIMRVMAAKTKNEGGPLVPNSGTWVKILCILCKARFGLWYGECTSSTKLWILSNEDSSVTQRQRISEERLSSVSGRMPYSAFPGPSHITEINHENVPNCTLMDVLTYKEVTSKFKCVVRVVAMCPGQVEKFWSPEDSDRYMVRFTLEDPTARIHAYIYAEDGENFFDGFHSPEVLTNARNRLLGISETDDGATLRNPPWVQCCLKSYYVDKSNPWSTRNYRIFHTRLVL